MVVIFIFITDNNVLPYSHSRVNDDCFICDVFLNVSFSLLQISPSTNLTGKKRSMACLSTLVNEAQESFMSTTLVITIQCYTV